MGEWGSIQHSLVRLAGGGQSQNKRTDGDKMRTRLLNEAAACVGISEAFADAGRLPATTLGSDIL
jgi:hypothetical protein